MNSIMENIMVYEALHKRRPFLDSFGEGLEIYGLLSFIQKFTAEMKPAFVPDGILCSDDVLQIMKPKISGEVITPEESRVYTFLKNYVKQCTDTSELITAVLTTLPTKLFSLLQN